MADKLTTWEIASRLADLPLLVSGSCTEVFQAIRELQEQARRKIAADMECEEDLTRPTYKTHYVTIQKGDPVCIGFFTRSMNASEVNCERCLAVIAQRRSMDLGGWLD